MVGLVALIQKWFFSKFVRSSEVSPRMRWYAILWGFLGAGVVSIVMTLCLGGSMGSAGLPEARKFYELGILAPAVEEFSKGLAPLLAAWCFGVKGRRALMIIGALSGVGFFLMETFLALVIAARNGSDAWSHEFAYRAVGFCLLHPSCSALFGLGVGIARNRTGMVSTAVVLLLGFLAAFSPHFWSNSLALMINLGHTREGWEYAFGLERTFLIGWVFAWLVLCWDSPCPPQHL
jgi:RsiW-degrading membrane proteinase PrsW (M82 family)